MTRRLTRALFAALLLLAAGLAAPEARAAEDGETQVDVVGHASDGVYLDFLPLGKIELPRIFLVRRADGGLGVDGYWSTKSALKSGEYYAIADPNHSAHSDADDDEAPGHATGDAVETTNHTPSETVGTIRDADGLAELIDAKTHIYATLVPADGGSVVLDFSLTRHLFFDFFSMAIVLVIFLTLAGRYKKGIGRDTAPRGGFQNMFEALVVFVRDELARPNLGDKTDKFLPYLLTVFSFILVANLVGLVPGGAAATSNIAITGALALCTFVITQINGSKDYWLHIFWPPGVPFLIKFILIPVELLGIFTKPIALAIRLFANMTAGYMVILSLIGLIFTFGGIFGPGVGYAVVPVSGALTVFIFALKLLVAFIQAYVFTMLSALFIGMAADSHDHGDAHGEGHLPHGIHDESPTPVLTERREGGVIAPTHAGIAAPPPVAVPA